MSHGRHINQASPLQLVAIFKRGPFRDEGWISRWSHLQCSWNWFPIFAICLSGTTFQFQTLLLVGRSGSHHDHETDLGWGLGASRYQTSFGSQFLLTRRPKVTTRKPCAQECWLTQTGASCHSFNPTASTAKIGRGKVISYLDSFSASAAPQPAFIRDPNAGNMMSGFLGRSNAWG